MYEGFTVLMAESAPARGTHNPWGLFGKNVSCNYASVASFPDIKFDLFRNGVPPNVPI